MDAYILTLLVFIPVVGAVAVLPIPRDRAYLIKWIAAGFTGLQVLLAFWLFAAFDRSSERIYPFDG